MRVLVTGYPGAIGAPLVHRLLEKEIQVVAIVKPKEGRVIPNRKGLSVFIGDVTDNTMDVAPLRRRGRFDAFFHVAGRVQYYEELREETFKTNVFGTRNMLAIAGDHLEIDRVIYASTCYVGGELPYLGEADVGRVTLAHNPYEQSKIEAEDCVRKYMGNPLIARLSTVIGDSMTGEIGRVGGYSGFAGSAYKIRKRLREFPNNPFLMAVNPSSTMNLVAREWAIEMLVLAGLSSIGGTIHLAHPNPVNMGWLFKQTFHKGFGLPLTYDREECEKTALHDNARWMQIQGAVSELVRYFGPYVLKDTTYGHERVKKIPGYVPPLEITEEVIGHQIDYMKRVLFAPRGPQPLPQAA